MLKRLTSLRLRENGSGIRKLFHTSEKSRLSLDSMLYYVFPTSAFLGVYVAQLHSHCTQGIDSDRFCITLSVLYLDGKGFSLSCKTLRLSLVMFTELVHINFCTDGFAREEVKILVTCTFARQRGCLQTASHLLTIPSVEIRREPAHELQSSLQKLLRTQNRWTS